MDFKLAMSLVSELKGFLAFMQSPDVRWESIQSWLDDHPRWRAKVGRYTRMDSVLAVADLKAYLIEQTGAPKNLVALAITPEIEAAAIIAIEKLQALYREREAQSAALVNIDPPKLVRRKVKQKRSRA